MVVLCWEDGGCVHWWVEFWYVGCEHLWMSIVVCGGTQDDGAYEHPYYV